MMRININVLVIIIISIVQLGIYGHLHGEQRLRDFSETITVKKDAITEIKVSNLSGEYRSLTDEEQIDSVIVYFNQFNYKRLVNDQTSYMPTRTIMIYLRDDNNENFIIPYGKEVMINHKVYQVKGGELDEQFLLMIYELIDSND